MIIACPNCGAALELPEESVGAKVQCPVCETSFVSSGLKEWRERTEQRFDNVVQSFKKFTKWDVHIIIYELAGVRFEYAPFRLLEVEDVIESPLGLMVVVDCMSTSPAALTSKLTLCLSKNMQVWKDLPGRYGVGVLLRRDKSDEEDENDSVNFENIRKREEWQRLSSDGVALPALLGVDFLNRDLVLNLADFNCLYITGGDTYAQSLRRETLIRGIVSCRDEKRVRFLTLDFMNTLSMIPEKYQWTHCEKLMDSNKDWKRNAVKYLTKITNEISKRKELFERSNCFDYGEYSQKYVLPRIVIFVEVNGNHLNRDAEEIFDGILNLVRSDLKSYGIHLILIDYGPFSLEADAFPYFIHNPDYLTAKDGSLPSHSGMIFNAEAQGRRATSATRRKLS